MHTLHATAGPSPRRAPIPQSPRTILRDVEPQRSRLFGAALSSFALASPAAVGETLTSTFDALNRTHMSNAAALEKQVPNPTDRELVFLVVADAEIVARHLVEFAGNPSNHSQGSAVFLKKGSATGLHNTVIIYWTDGCIRLLIKPRVNARKDILWDKDLNKFISKSGLITMGVLKIIKPLGGYEIFFSPTLNLMGAQPIVTLSRVVHSNGAVNLAGNGEKIPASTKRAEVLAVSEKLVGFGAIEFADPTTGERRLICTDTYHGISLGKLSKLLGAWTPVQKMHALRSLIQSFVNLLERGIFFNDAKLDNLCLRMEGDMPFLTIIDVENDMGSTYSLYKWVGGKYESSTLAKYAVLLTSLRSRKPGTQVLPVNLFQVVLNQLFFEMSHVILLLLNPMVKSVKQASHLNAEPVSRERLAIYTRDGKEKVKFFTSLALSGGDYPPAAQLFLDALHFPGTAKSMTAFRFFTQVREVIHSIDPEHKYSGMPEGYYETDFEIERVDGLLSAFNMPAEAKPRLHVVAKPTLKLRWV